jgi:hypothetical protein
MEKKRNAYRILVGKPEGKRPIGRPRCTWEDNFKIIITGKITFFLCHSLSQKLK